MSKSKNIFAKVYALNWSEEDFVIKDVKKLCLRHATSDLNGEEIIGDFYKKELQKTNQKEFRIEKSNWEERWLKNTSNGKVTIILLTVGLKKDFLI